MARRKVAAGDYLWSLLERVAEARRERGDHGEEGAHAAGLDALTIGARALYRAELGEEPPPPPARGAGRIELERRVIAVAIGARALYRAELGEEQQAQGTRRKRRPASPPAEHAAPARKRRRAPRA